MWNFIEGANPQLCSMPAALHYPERVVRYAFARGRLSPGRRPAESCASCAFSRLRAWRRLPHLAGYTCPAGYWCAHTLAPNWGYSTFGNFGFALLVLFQCITLTNWTDVMYYTQARAPRASRAWAAPFDAIRAHFTSVRCPSSPPPAAGRCDAAVMAVLHQLRDVDLLRAGAAGGRGHVLRARLERARALATPR